MLLSPLRIQLGLVHLGLLPTCPALQVDLHALHVDEAIKAVADHVTALSILPSSMLLVIITGRGKHSRAGPQVQPAIRAWLQDRGLVYRECIGSFEVELKKK